MLKFIVRVSRSRASFASRRQESAHLLVTTLAVVVAGIFAHAPKAFAKPVSEARVDKACGDKMEINCSGRFCYSGCTKFEKGTLVDYNCVFPSRPGKTTAKCQKLTFRRGPQSADDRRPTNVGTRRPAADSGRGPPAGPHGPRPIGPVVGRPFRPPVTRPPSPQGARPTGPQGAGPIRGSETPFAGGGMRPSAVRPGAGSAGPGPILRRR